MDGRRGGWVGWWQKFKKRSKMTEIVEFRVAIYDVYMLLQRANIPLQGQEGRALTVEAISCSHRQIRALL